MSREGVLRLGFIALNDAASLIVAQERGLFAAEGLEVELVREVSWATIRDKVNVGMLQGAHMLAPLALCTSLGAVGAEPVPLVAPMALNLNGPAITLLSRLASAVGDSRNAEALDKGPGRLVGRGCANDRGAIQQGHCGAGLSDTVDNNLRDVGDPIAFGSAVRREIQNEPGRSRRWRNRLWRR